VLLQTLDEPLSRHNWNIVFMGVPDLLTLAFAGIIGNEKGTSFVQHIMEFCAYSRSVSAQHSALMKRTKKFDQTRIVQKVYADKLGDTDIQLFHLCDIG
jgi:hypothetical protein